MGVVFRELAALEEDLVAANESIKSELIAWERHQNPPTVTLGEHEAELDCLAELTRVMITHGHRRFSTHIFVQNTSNAKRLIAAIISMIDVMIKSMKCVEEGRWEEACQLGLAASSLHSALPNLRVLGGLEEKFKIALSESISLRASSFCREIISRSLEAALKAETACFSFEELKQAHLALLHVGKEEVFADSLCEYFNFAMERAARERQLTQWLLVTHSLLATCDLMCKHLDLDPFSLRLLSHPRWGKLAVE